MSETINIDVLEPIDLYSEIYPSEICHSPETSKISLLNYMKDISAETVAILSSKRCYAETLAIFPKFSIDVFEKDGELVKAETNAAIIIVSEDNPAIRYRLLQIAFATGKPIFFETVSREILKSGLIYPIDSSITDLHSRTSLKIHHINSDQKTLENRILRVA